MRKVVNFFELHNIYKKIARIKIFFVSIKRIKTIQYNSNNKKTKTNG